jgi:hypothetical protein
MGWNRQLTMVFERGFSTRPNGTGSEYCSIILKTSPSMLFFHGNKIIVDTTTIVIIIILFHGMYRLYQSKMIPE